MSKILQRRHLSAPIGYLVVKKRGIDKFNVELELICSNRQGSHVRSRQKIFPGINFSAHNIVGG